MLDSCLLVGQAAGHCGRYQLRISHSKEDTDEITDVKLRMKSKWFENQCAILLKIIEIISYTTIECDSESKFAAVSVKERQSA